MKRALITGVTGQDGAYLARLLVDDGYEVFGTTRDLASADRSRLEIVGVSNDVHLLELAAPDSGALARSLRELQPREVYHLAAEGSVGHSFAEPAASFISTASASLGVFEAVRLSSVPVKLVVAGSGEVFGGASGRPCDETTNVAPLSPYAAGKAATWNLASIYRRAYGLCVSVALLFNHESPLRGPGYVSEKICRAVALAARGQPVKLELGDTSVVRDWGWAPEYVVALKRIAAQETPDDFVVATGESHSLDEFVQAAYAAVGLDAAGHVVHNRALLRPTELPIVRANPAKAERVLGWKAEVRFSELVERLVRAACERA